MLETQRGVGQQRCCAARGRRSRSRLPAAGRERAPLPHSKRERDLVGRFADAVESGDVDGMVALLTDDAWLTMPPEPLRVPGPRGDRARSCSDREDRARRAAAARADPRQRPAGVRLLPPGRPDRDRARRTALFVLTLEGDRISAITWFADTQPLRALRTAADAAAVVRAVQISMLVGHCWY